MKPHLHAQYLCALICLPIVALLYCQPGGAADGGLETTNGYITVAAVDHSICGSARPGTRLALCDSSYSPITMTQHPRFLLVDNSGTYCINQLRPGSYTLTAWFTPDNLAGYLDEIIIGEDHTHSSDTCWLPPAGTITGNASLNGFKRDSVIVFLVGTPLHDTTNEDGIFRLENVPVGEFTLEAFYEDKSRVSGIHRASIGITLSENESITKELHLEPVP